MFIDIDEGKARNIDIIVRVFIIVGLMLFIIAVSMGAADNIGLLSMALLMIGIGMGSYVTALYIVGYFDNN